MSILMNFVLTGVLSSITAFSPYENGNVGFTVDLPEDATIVGISPAPPSCLITCGNDRDTWHIRIDRGPNPEKLTPKELVFEAKNKHQDPSGTNILQNQAVVLGEAVGWLLLIEQKNAGTQGTSTAVFGWLALPVPGDQYLMTSILTSDIGWKTQAKAINATLISLKVLDPVALISKKLEALDTATSLLNTFDASSLNRLIGFKEWRRIQQTPPEGGNPIDIGYSYLVVWEGNAKAIEGFTDPSYEHGKPDGIVLTMRTRLVPDAVQGAVIDTQARYWMSFDGKEERWKNQIKRWKGASQVFESETGIRQRPRIGQPKASLRVFQENLTASTIETPYETTAEEPWLPRAMHWLLGPLLSTSNDGEQYLWNAYENAGSEKVITRSDAVSKTQDGSFQLNSSYGDQGMPIQTHFHPDGHLLEQLQSGGVRISGSNEETLRAIWEPRQLW